MAGVIDDVDAHMSRYVISTRGKPKAVLMCVDDYEGWLETLEILSCKDALKDIKEARRELAEGKHYTHEEVFGKKVKNTK